MRRNRNTTKITNGHDQLAEFEAVLADHHARATERHGVVNDRIAQLEAELSSLRTLREKLQAAS